jgi:hypothetical protein
MSDFVLTPEQEADAQRLAENARRYAMSALTADPLISIRKHQRINCRGLAPAGDR